MLKRHRKQQASIFSRIKESFAATSSSTPLRSSGEKVDKGLFLIVIILIFLGLLAVADASAPLAQAAFGDPFFFVKQQLMWAAVAIVGMVVASIIPYEFWKKNAKAIFFGTAFLLVLVLIPGFGSRLLGARRWLVFGPVSIQPSEIMKLSLIIYFSFLYSENAPIKKYIAPIAAVALLIMMQPDLGTTIITLSIGLVMIFTAGFPLLELIVTFAGGIIFSLIFALSSEYRRNRLLTFFSPEHDPGGASYHVRQILIALGTGGWFGVGLGQSRQKQLFLPETATDSIFAIIAEELGFVGALAIVLLLVYTILRIVKYTKLNDPFAKMFVMGVATWISAQMFFNISSMVALTPLTGIPLPFISYGGTSLSMLVFAVGIILNMTRSR